MSSRPTKSSSGRNATRHTATFRREHSMGAIGSKRDVLEELEKQFDEMKRDNEKSRITQDSIQRSLEEKRLSVSDIERAFAEQTASISEEIQRAVGEGMKKVYRPQRRFDAMRSRAFTLDAVDSEVAKYRQRPHLDLTRAHVNEFRSIIDAKGPKIQKLLDGPNGQDLCSSINFDSFNTIFDKEPERILSDVLILEYVEVELMANSPSGHDAGREVESTKAVKDLLSAWGPIISKKHWEFIKTQEGFDGYAEISAGQMARFGHLLVV